MSETTGRLREVYMLAEQMLQKAPDMDALCLAVGLLLGARHHLITLEEWEEWGLRASTVLLTLAQRVPESAAKPPEKGEEEER